MKRMNQLAIMLSVVLAGAGVGWAELPRAWVSTNGSDINSCERAEPCRTISAALAAVRPAGEIVPIDSGGYGGGGSGVLTIDKSASIIVPAGIHAAINPASGNAMLVSVGISDRVLLRNLKIISRGSSDYGVIFGSQGSLTLEDCLISGFDTNVFSQGALTVRNTSLRDGIVGIQLGFGKTVIRGCRIEFNYRGIFVGQDASLTLRDTVISTSAIGLNSVALSGQSVSVFVDSCLIVHAGTGIQAESDGSMSGVNRTRVARSTITQNEMGLAILNGGCSSCVELWSHTTNTNTGNTTNGSFNGDFSIK